MAAPLKKPAPASGHHSGGERGRYQTPELLDFVSGLMAREDPALRAIREDTVKDGLPPISVGPDEGKLLDFLARACGAKKAVEIGTLAGYSGSWIARALPADGVLHTFEYSPRHAEVARRNFERAGVAAKVRVHVGAAVETLKDIEAEGPFDFVFIDADKVSYGAYARWAAAHTRPGAIVAADNAYLFGKLHLDPARAGDDAAGVPAMRECLEVLADPKLFSSCSMIPTGEGLAVGLRRG
jgi:caffeoyl-CoA O-methyltransferase